MVRFPAAFDDLGFQEQHPVGHARHLANPSNPAKSQGTTRAFANTQVIDAIGQAASLIANGRDEVEPPETISSLRADQTAQSPRTSRHQFGKVFPWVGITRAVASQVCTHASQFYMMQLVFHNFRQGI